MGLSFLSVEECHDRLIGTVIFLKDEPIYVMNFAGSLLHYVTLPYLVGPGAAKSVDWRDKNLRAHDLSLGYMNYMAPENGIPSAHYLVRTPMRQWKQGIHGGVVNFPRNYLFENALRAESFKHMLMNVYPNYREGLALIRKKKGSVAFSRKFAIRAGEVGVDYLAYRGKDIASSMDGESFRLGPDYIYLQESLHDVGVKVV